MKNFQKYLSKSLLAVAALLVGASTAWAQVSLGSASGFSVLGGTNVTCTSGVVTGDVGVAPGGAVPFTNTGCTFGGAIPPATNTAAVQARIDFLSAYAALRLQTNSCVQLPGNLADQNLAPGVYCIDAVAKAGTLTLTGPATGVWVFLVDGALTGTNFSVAMAGGALPCNVYWAPTAAVTMTTSAFKGNVLAGDAIGGSITLTGGTLAGRAFSNVAVTMTDANVIGCDALSGSTSTCKDNDRDDEDKDHHKCNQGVGNGSEGCDPGHSNKHHSSNDEDGGTPGNPGRR
ncbi:MAG: ice-binding family protein [Sulfuricella sp.]